jgi:putative DNA methylase
MLKRLLEVALPLQEVSAESSKEKRQLSKIHMYWAPRPLQTCRAVCFAALIPDPDDPVCPEEFRTLVRAILSRDEFRPKNIDGTPVEDTPRNRCLELIKYLVKWEHSNNPQYVEPARTLITSAHKILHPEAEGDVPKVLDPFAGRGAIPLEALRLGCEAHAIDLNPVAHLIELCTLVYPQRYGKPDSRPVPDYIQRLVAHNRSKRKAKGESDLFEKDGPAVAIKDGEIIPDVEITEQEYRKNPLAADVKYWGHWALERIRYKLAQFYPLINGQVPVAYLWAKTITCPNPTCRQPIPLIRQFLLSKRQGRVVAILPHVKNGQLNFDIKEGTTVTVDPTQGTVQNATARCLACNSVAKAQFVRKESESGRLTHTLMAIVTANRESSGKAFNAVTASDRSVVEEAAKELERISAVWTGSFSFVPDESISGEAPRRISPLLYRITRFSGLFNERQLLVLGTLAEAVSGIPQAASSEVRDNAYLCAVVTYCSFLLSKFADHNSAMQRWHPGNEQMTNTFSRQALPMVWDYCEANPFSQSSGGLHGSLKDVCDVVGICSAVKEPAHVSLGSATRLSYVDDSFRQL